MAGLRGLSEQHYIVIRHNNIAKKSDSSLVVNTLSFRHDSHDTTLLVTLAMGLEVTHIRQYNVYDSMGLCVTTTRLFHFVLILDHLLFLPALLSSWRL